MTAPRTRWTRRSRTGVLYAIVYGPSDGVSLVVYQDGSRWVATVRSNRGITTRYASSERAAKRRAVAEARRIGGVR